MLIYEQIFGIVYQISISKRYDERKQATIKIHEYFFINAISSDNVITAFTLR